MSKIKLEEEKPSNILDILVSPSQQMCLYGPCYWIIHKNHLQSGSITYSSESVFCSNCDGEIGILLSPKSLQLWNSGIVWTRCEAESGSSAPTPTSINPNIALEDFKKIVFSIIRESTNLFTCKFLLKCAGSERLLFLWNLDRNLTVFTTSFVGTGDPVHLKPQFSVKLMFSSGDIDLDPSIDLADVDQKEVLVPNQVFEAGLEALKSTSSYTCPDAILQSGYLIY
jgi:hypothetical protein